MTITPRSLALAAVCAAGALLPAPLAQAQDHGGTGCRLLVVPAPTASDPDAVRLFVTGGPVYAIAEPTGSEPQGPATDVQIHCSVQVNSNDAASPDADSESSAPGTGVSFLEPTEVTVSYGPQDTLYICSQLTFTDTNGDPHVTDFDANPTAPGVQCPPTLSRLLITSPRS